MLLIYSAGRLGQNLNQAARLQSPGVLWVSEEEGQQRLTPAPTALPLDVSMVTLRPLPSRFLVLMKLQRGAEPFAFLLVKLHKVPGRPLLPPALQPRT